MKEVKANAKDTKAQVKDFLTGVFYGVAILSSLAFISFFATGCSNQVRTSSAQVTEEELMAFYATMSQGTSAMSGSSAVVSALNAGSTTEMFFVKDDDSRPPESIIAVDDLSFVGSQYNAPAGELPYSSYDVGMQHAQVFFLDGYVNDGSQPNDPRAFVLELSIEDSLTGQINYFEAESTYSSQTGESSYSFSKTDFQVTLTSNSGGNMTQIMLYSTDVNPSYEGELSDTAKFEIYEILADGSVGRDLGQISAMHLYGAK